MTPGQLITPQRAAEVIGVHVQTLAAWRVRGGGPPFMKIGRFVRYDVADLGAWLESRRRLSTSDEGEPARLTA